jgi:hypothetical protein
MAQGRKAGRTPRNLQDDSVTVVDEYLRGIRLAAREGENPKRLPEERVSRISYLNAITASVIRVLEEGIKNCCRSTVSPTRS